MTARIVVSRQAAALAADLQPLLDRHETFPEIYGEADGLAELQAALHRAAVVFGGEGVAGEPF